MTLLTLGLAGCPATHQSPPVRAQEAATELNTNTRFGRMEMAIEKVAPAAREAFLERRRSWGGSVRVADYEMAGFRMKGDEDAEMLVKVAWYRIDQGDLRTTLLRQSWHDFKGEWRLVEETRAEGDVGLIGDRSPTSITTTTAATGPTSPVSGTPRSPQFPTVRLGGGPEPRPEAATAPATIPPREETGD